MIVKLLASILIFILSTSLVHANEANKYFGDRSWQWKSPNDKALDNQRLMIRCKSNPEDCNFVGGPNGTSNGGVGGGLGLANGQNIGNNITIYVVGDGNVVEVSGDQTNNGDQEVDIDIVDNDLDIIVDNDSQVINGDNATGNQTNNGDSDSIVTQPRMPKLNHPKRPRR